jgi:type VI secretion system secreted protein Hcp
MPIYVKYNNIPGDVTAAGHEKWIEVNSFQWGVGRGISSPTGGSSDREASAPSVSEIVVTKPIDIASAKLLDESLEGEGEDVTIDFCKTDKGQLNVYLSYTMNNTMISGYSISSGGDRPQESLSFSFTKIACRDVSLGAKNEDGSPATVTYDVGLAKTV